MLAPQIPAKLWDSANDPEPKQGQESHNSPKTGRIALAIVRLSIWLIMLNKLWNMINREHGLAINFLR